MAEKVGEILDRGEKDFKLLYGNDLSIKEKINKIATTIYGASGVITPGRR